MISLKHRLHHREGCNDLVHANDLRWNVRGICDTVCTTSQIIASALNTLCLKSAFSENRSTKLIWLVWLVENYHKPLNWVISDCCVFWLVVAVDRFLVISRPMDKKPTRTRACITIVLIWFYAALFDVKSGLFYVWIYANIRSWRNVFLYINSPQKTIKH